MADPNVLAAAMQRMWAQFLPQIEERVAVLETAAAALEQATLSTEQCAAARHAAHNLAGVLGTFGLAEGTALAREAEPIYATGLPIDPDKTVRLAQIAVLLRTMILARQ